MKISVRVYNAVIILILCLSFVQLNSQAVLEAYYPMDDCTMDDAVNVNDGIYFGPNPCVCGVESNGLQFDGNISFADFPPSINDILMGDFSMSFYARLNNTGATPVDIFSLSSSCSLDSMFAFRYFPGISQLRVRLSDSPQNFIELSGELSQNACWHYIAIVKSRAVANLYIDGILVDQDAAVSDLNLVVDDNLSISNSECLSAPINPDERLQGRIDELRFYSGILTDRQVANQNLQPDRIITGDTTIFIGENALIRTGGSCSGNFSWNPTTGLSDPNSLNPLASPTESTTYTLTIDDSDCMVTDDIRINVVERQDLTCEGLSLPSAFTPNQDGVNEVFTISNIFLIDELLSFEIFNKWGGRGD